MKKILINIFIIICCGIYTQAQEVCQIGLKYQKSDNKNWGLSMPVVTDVVNESPAYKANIKVGDIILSVDNIETKSLTTNQINQLLQSDESHKIVRVKNLSGIKEVLLTKKCHLANSVSEEQLSRAFSFYSLRDVCDRMVMYPIKSKSEVDFDFTNVKTFAFANQENNTDTDNTIFGVISDILKSSGLKQSDTNPDILVDIFYKLDENKDALQDVELTYTHRFNFATSDMDRLPILNIGSPSNFGKYTISFGVNILAGAKKNNIVWTSKAEDLLFESIPMSYYACSVLPLMFRGFPYIEKSEYPTYLFSRRKYNYTGIRFESGNISHVVEVDDLSPAYKAGIKPGDNVIAINGIRLSKTNQEDITKAYIKFIKETDRYRLPLEFAFRDANGVAACRYWDDNKKKDIADVFVKNKYYTPFSYLFFFRDYVNPNGDKDIVFEIERNGSVYSVIVTPEIKNYTNISVK